MLRLPSLMPLFDPDRATGSWRRQGLTRIIVAWAFGTVFFNVTIGAPFAAFARKLGAGDLLFGVLSAAPTLGVVAQTVSAYLVERTGQRRRIFVVAGTIHRLIWLLIALLPWMVPATSSTLRLAGLTLLVVLASACGHFGSPAWLSWMSDFVPLKVRGAFFARRMRVGTLIGLLSAVVAGEVLDLWPGFATYSLLFAVASLCGVVDVQLFRAIPEPKMRCEPELPSLAALFLGPLRSSTFRRFVVFWISFSLAISIMGPSLWLFTLESLSFTKLQANLVLLVANMMGLAALSPFWGRLIDRFGNRPVLRICTLIMAFVPLGWVVAGRGSFWWLFLLTLGAGSFWAGIELANFNLVLGLFPQKMRSVYIAAFGVWTGMASAAAPMLGGAITNALAGSTLSLGPLLLDPYQQVFLLSFALRLLAVGLLLPRVREEGAAATSVLLRTVASEVGARVRRGQ